jgi:hypothetical protein
MQVSAGRPRGHQRPRCGHPDPQSTRLQHFFALDPVGAFRGASGNRRSRPKPELVFFFDEAHLLFQDAHRRSCCRPSSRSCASSAQRAWAIYFVTQSPADIPDSVLGQLGNRVSSTRCAPIPRRNRKPCASPPRVSGPTRSWIQSGSSANSVSAKPSYRPCRPRGPLHGRAAHPDPPPGLAYRQSHGGRAPGRARARSESAALRGGRRPGECARATPARAREKQQAERDEAKIPRNAKRPATRSGAHARRARQSRGEAFVKSMARSLGSAAGRSLGKKLFRGSWDPCCARGAGPGTQAGSEATPLNRAPHPGDQAGLPRRTPAATPAAEG